MVDCRRSQFIRKYNAWEMNLQAERLSEEARRRRMYGFPTSFACARPLQVTVSTGGWKLSVMTDEI